MSVHTIDKSVVQRAQEILIRDCENGEAECDIMHLSPQQRAKYTALAEQELRAEDRKQAQAAGAHLVLDE